ncbi:MAG: SelB C-terminal domain-containing protein, partial [Pyrinomonadaceae bacterium]
AIIEADGVYAGRASSDSLSHAALEEIEAHHRREPLARGLARETLRERRFAHAAPEIFRAVLASLESGGKIFADKDIVRAASHSLSLNAEDAALRNRLEEVYSKAALEAPALDEALERAGVASAGREHARKILQLLIDASVVVRVQGDLFFHTDALTSLVVKLREYGATHEPERLIDVPAFKELAGVSRKYAIPLLEYLDRERITQRAGDKRIIK